MLLSSHRGPASLDVTERRRPPISFSGLLACALRDLRGPLRQVLESAETLRLAPLPLDYRDLPESLHADARRALDQVNLAVELAKLEEGEVKSLNLVFDLELAAADICESLSALAGSRSVDLALTVSPDLPRRAVGDPDRIRSIFRDLCESAIRDSQSGLVSLELDSRKESGDGFLLRGCLRDSSAGAADSRPCACLLPCAKNVGCPEFDAAVQMTIARGLIESLGGSIETRLSLAGRNTIFEIPLQQDPQLWKYPALPFPTNGRLALIAGPGATVRGALRRQLEAVGIETSELESAAGVLRWLEGARSRPDMLFLDTADVEWEAAAIALQEKWPDVPGIAATSPPGAAPPEMQLRRARIGASLSRVFHPRKMRAVVNRLIGHGGTDAAFPAPGGEPRLPGRHPADAPKTEPAVFDQAAALERCGGDEPMLEELAEEARRQLTRCDGALRMAVNRQDADEALLLLSAARQTAEFFSARVLGEALEALGESVGKADWSHSQAAFAGASAHMLRFIEALPAAAGER